MAEDLVEKVVQEQTIKSRIDELIKEREKYIVNANFQVAAYNGAIGELQRLINPKEKIDGS
jgi:hypothetical protein